MKSWTRLTLFLAVLAAALAFGAYRNSLHGRFTLDDRLEIVNNASIVDLDQPLIVLFGHGLTRPLVNLSYAIDYAWNGRKEFGFHVTNMILHVVNVLLLFVLVRRLVTDSGRGAEHPVAAGEADLTAFISASLFAVHPMMTEAVSYVSGRSDLLATAFFVSSLYCFRRGFDGGRSWLAAGSLGFLLALGSKETSAIFPFVLLASDVLVGSGSGWRTRLWRLHVPLLLLVCMAAAVRIWFHVEFEYRGAAPGFSWQNVALQAHVVVRYLSLLVLPLGQSVVPAVSPIVSIRDVRIVTTLFIFGGIGTLAFLTRRRAPLVTLGIMWFLLALVPSSVLTLLTQFGQSMSEHRAYLASCGFLMATAAVVARLTCRDLAPSRLRLSWIAAATSVVLAALLSLTLTRNRVWADPVRLWEEAVQRSPQAMFGHFQLGVEYRLAGDCHAAEAAFRRAIQLAPDRLPPYLELAGCQIDRDSLDEARTILQLALTRMPRETEPRLPLAAIEERRFRPAEALRLCREALALEPGLIEAKECVQRNERKLSDSQR